MKLENVIIKAVVYKVVEREYLNRQTGQMAQSHDVVLDLGEGVETYSCTDEFYDSYFSNELRLQEVCLLCRYDNTYNRFVIIKAVSDEEVVDILKLNLSTSSKTSDKKSVSAEPPKTK